MKLKPMSRDRLREIYETEILCDFPPAERKPLKAMEQLREDGRYLPYEALDDDGGFVGYALLWRSHPETVLLLDYLGVTKSKRSSGIGSQILRLLQEEFPQWQGLLMESEAPDGGKDDAAQRRRLDFYRRNGCRELSYDTWIFGVHYKVFSLTKKPTDERSLQLAHQEIYHAYFTAEQRAQCIRIPFDPAREAPPAMDWNGVRHDI